MKRCLRFTLSLLLVLALLLPLAGHSFAVSSFTTVCPFKGETFTHPGEKFDAEVKSMLDISEFQGKVNFYKLRAQGVDYVILRCGHRYSSSGVIGEDARLYENIENAIKAGMQIGFYVFSQAINTKEAVEEAEFCLQRVEKYREYITLPIFMDYEFYSRNPEGRLSVAVGNGTLNKSKMTENAVAFCERVLSAGYRAGVYANASFYTDYLNGDKLYAAGYEIWAAHYTNDITKFDFWTSKTPVFNYWQYGGTEIEGCCGDPQSAWLRVKSAQGTGYIHVADVEFTGAQSCVVTAQTANIYKGTAATSPLATTLSAAMELEILSYYTSVATDTNFYYYRQQAALPKPAFSLSVNSATSVHISWSAVEGADYYRVYMFDTSSDTLSLLQKTQETSFVCKGLDSQKTYGFLVRAFYRSGEGSAYDQKDIKSLRVIPKAPSVQLTAEAHQVQLSWEAQNSASQYLVYAVNPENGQMQFLAKIEGTDYLVENTEAETAYAFLVLAANALGQISDFEQKDIVRITTPTEPAPVEEHLTASLTASSGAIKIAWNAIDTATYYRVYSFDAASKQYHRLAQTTDTVWTHKALKANTRYTYLVRYFLADGSGSAYTAADHISAKTNVAAPKLTLQAVNESTVKLSWNKVAGAATYKIYLYNVKSGKYSLLGKSAAQTYSCKKAKYGQSHTFLVRAYDSQGIGSTYSAANHQTIKMVITKAAFKLSSPKKGAVKLSWNSVPMASYYKIYKYQGGKYKAVGSTKALSYTLKGFASGKKASFLVRAYTASGKAAGFSVKDVKTLKVK